MPSFSHQRPIPYAKKIRYIAEAIGIYILYGFFAILPVGAASWLGGQIGRGLFPHFALSRKARRNLRLAMPDLDKTHEDEIIKGMWENLGRVFAEYPHLHHLNGRITVSGQEHMVAARDSSHGSIMVGGHFANWEVYAAGANTMGLGLHLVYRKPNNPYLDGLLRRSRAKAGALAAIPKTIEGARQMVSTLKNGETIGALIDQKFNEGIAVPFFGNDAMTTPSVAQLAFKMGVPLYPARIRRTHGANFEVTIFPPIPVPENGSREEKIFQMLTELHTMYEDWIRDEPEQWLWIHRRWKQS